MWYNVFITWLLRSPLHGMLDGSMMLVTYAGRKSGRQYTLPVNYVFSGETLLTTSYRSRTWWRNLRGGAPVRLVLRGQELPARAEVADQDEQVTAWLEERVLVEPTFARYTGVALDAAGKPVPETVRQAAANRVVVRFFPNQS